MRSSVESSRNYMIEVNHIIVSGAGPLPWLRRLLRRSSTRSRGGRPGGGRTRSRFPHRGGFWLPRQCEAAGGVAFGFEAAEAVEGLEEGEQEGLLRGPGADDPGGDAVDAGVEVVEADVGAAEVIAADESFISARVGSSSCTTWSLSQRTPRLTWRRISGTNMRSEEILSAMVSVGWKWPASRQ